MVFACMVSLIFTKLFIELRDAADDDNDNDKTPPPMTMTARI